MDNIKLSQAIDNYIDKQRPFLKERTIINYEERKVYVLKHFGDLFIQDYTQDYVQDKIVELQRKGYRKAGVQGMICVIKMATGNKYNRFRYLSEVKKDSKAYSEEDVIKIDRYICNNKKRTFIPIMLAIHTGMRLAEINGLKWEDIDLENKVIYVRRNAVKYKGKIIESLPKTKSGQREIPIDSVLVSYLTRFKNGTMADCYVVSNKETPKDARPIQRTNQALLNRLGIEYKGFHSYRHYYATHLLKKSQDFKAVQEIMGHSNIAITQNIYNHPDIEQKREVIESSKNCEVPEYIEKQIEYLQEQISRLNIVVGQISVKLTELSKPKDCWRPENKVVYRKADSFVFE